MAFSYRHHKLDYSFAQQRPTLGVVFQNDGIIDVAGYTAATVDALDITGDMIATDSSVINIDVGNDSGSEVNDTLAVSGNLTMAGTLNASFIASNSPAAGDVFNIVTFSTVTAGTYFNAINGLHGDGTTLLDIDIDTGGGLISLTAVANALTPTSGSDSYEGSSAADYVYGGDGADILDGDGGADVLIGGAGDDVIKISDNSFHFIDGGEGTDKLVALNGLDLTAVRNDIVSGFEVLDIGFGGLTLDADDVMSITDGTNALTGTDKTLVVTRNDFGEAIDIGTGWSAATTTTLTIDGETMTFDKQVHSATGATIYVETSISSLAGLDGTNGFTITTTDSTDFKSFSLIKGMGDVNGDGFEDFIYSMTPDGNVSSARTFLVYGQEDGFVSSIDIEALKAAGDALEFTGTPNSATHSMFLGDINGDGYGDFALSMPFDDTAGTDAGRTTIIYGGDSLGTNNEFDTTAVDGTNGYQIFGNVGDSLDNGFQGGDVNGDGINDISISNRNAAATGFVLYGDQLAAADANDGSSDGVIDVDLLRGSNGGDGTLGFTVTSNGGSTGNVVIKLDGDIDGDGFADMLVIDSTADTAAGVDTGRVMLVFGSASATGADRDYSSADGTSVVHLEDPVSAAISTALYADLNGDGLDDVVVAVDGTNTGYVVYGKDDWSSTPTVNLESLNGSDGFKFTLDVSTTDYRFDALGDVNGDGFEDIGFLDHTNNEGHVVFGSDGFGSTFDIDTMTGEQGFSYDISNDNGAHIIGADLNGDGFNDIISSSTATDEVYVIYGGDFVNLIDSAGTSGADNLIGTSSNDILDGGDGGADIMHAGAGDDKLIIGDADFARIDGGSGQDTLFLDGEFDLDFTLISAGQVTGIEHIDMNNDMMNVLDIDFATVLDIGEAIDQLVGEANMLVITKDEGDTVNLIGNWTERAEQPAAAASHGYTVYDSDDSNASVAIQNSLPGGGLA